MACTFSREFVQNHTDSDMKKELIYIWFMLFFKNFIIHAQCKSYDTLFIYIHYIKMEVSKIV